MWEGRRDHGWLVEVQRRRWAIGRQRSWRVVPAPVVALGWRWRASVRGCAVANACWRRWDGRGHWRRMCSEMRGLRQRCRLPIWRHIALTSRRLSIGRLRLCCGLRVWIVRHRRWGFIGRVCSWLLMRNWLCRRIPGRRSTIWRPRSRRRNAS